MSFIVTTANAEDIDGILALQERNQLANGGQLSACFPREWFLHAIAQQWLLIARSGSEVVGYVAFTPQAAQAHVPIIAAMLQAHPSPAAYLHGPICVAEEFRRRGVASALIAAQRKQMQQAPVLSFIRADNEASRKAHLAIGMQEVGAFTLNAVDYVIVAA